MCTYAYFYIMYIKKFSFQDVSLVLFHSIVEMSRAYMWSLLLCMVSSVLFL